MAFFYTAINRRQSLEYVGHTSSRKGSGRPQVICRPWVNTPLASKISFSLCRRIVCHLSYLSFDAPLGPPTPFLFFPLSLVIIPSQASRFPIGRSWFGAEAWYSKYASVPNLTRSWPPPLFFWRLVSTGSCFLALLHVLQLASKTGSALSGACLSTFVYPLYSSTLHWINSCRAPPLISKKIILICCICCHIFIHPSVLLPIYIPPPFQPSFSFFRNDACVWILRPPLLDIGNYDLAGAVLSAAAKVSRSPFFLWSWPTDGLIWPIITMDPWSWNCLHLC